MCSIIMQISGEVPVICQGLTLVAQILTDGLKFNGDIHLRRLRTDILCVMPTHSIKRLVLLSPFLRTSLPFFAKKL